MMNIRGKDMLYVSGYLCVALSLIFYVISMFIASSKKIRLEIFSFTFLLVGIICFLGTFELSLDAVIASSAFLLFVTCFYQILI